MGDRGNIVIRDQYTEGGEVYFYAHWNGSNLAETVQAALARKQRWNDGPYLARIIFCELVKGDEDGETGYGISCGLCDNGHALLVVDMKTSTVYWAGEGDTAKAITEPQTFAEFVESPTPEPSREY